MKKSIRLTVYQHLVGSKADGADAFCVLRHTMLGWCFLHDYNQACHVFDKYVEEIKKLENICFDCQSSVPGIGSQSLCTEVLTGEPPLSPDESYTSLSFTSQNPPEKVTSIGEDCEPLFPAHAKKSSAELAVPHPLLCGMPGRELSASKTDGAAFAGDFDVPPVLVYPNDLSTTDFKSHPLFASLGLTVREGAQLGLVFPKRIAGRGF